MIIGTTHKDREFYYFDQRFDNQTNRLDTLVSKRDWSGTAIESEFFE